MIVEVYKNLHKGCYSVRSAEGENKSRVVEHKDVVLLKDATFVVREAGRKKVLNTKTKNVHAFIRGNLVDEEIQIQDTERMRRVTYDPYKYSSFVFVDTLEPVSGVFRIVSATQYGVFVAGSCASHGL